MTTERSQRKLAAILSADVKEYSRLMSQDEGGTIRTLTEYKEAMSMLIQDYKGRVVDAPGDNLLAEFGCAVDAMQKAIIDLNTLIPVHLSIIDGLYGMEGEGAPTQGNPIKMDLLIAGIDIMATETIGAAAMGFEPASMPYLEQAVKKGLGSACKTEEIDLRGVSLSEVCRPFEPASVSSTWR